MGVMLFRRRATFESHFKPTIWELRALDGELAAAGVPLPPMTPIAWFAATATGIFVAALVAKVVRSVLRAA